MLSTIPLHRKIVWLVVFFLLVGQIMLFSATGVLGLHRYGSEFYYVARQAITAIIGIGMMIAISHIPYQTWGKLAYPLLAMQIVLIASFVHEPWASRAGLDTLVASRGHGVSTE